MMTRPYRWQMRQPHVYKRAPAYAEDNRAILSQLPGYTSQSIEALIASRVVCDTPNSSKAPESMGFAQLRQLRAISELDADYCEKLGIAKA